MDRYAVVGAFARKPLEFTPDFFSTAAAAGIVFFAGIVLAIATRPFFRRVDRAALQPAIPGMVSVFDAARRRPACSGCCFLPEDMAGCRRRKALGALGAAIEDFESTQMPATAAALDIKAYRIENCEAAWKNASALRRRIVQFCDVVFWGMLVYLLNKLGPDIHDAWHLAADSPARTSAVKSLT
ncbi:MAG: hypothetical protein ACREC6_00735, partial [Hyphomicrobiaceae bacterium]